MDLLWGESGQLGGAAGGRAGRWEGNLAGFWHTIGLCRFTPGELDDYGPWLRLGEGERLLGG